MTKSNTVWAFDLGKASIGEAVRSGNQFLHKASLLIPEKFAETRSAATRRRMWRTRVAHREREKWLSKVMRQAGVEVLHGRNYDQNGTWKPGEPADERLEREFAKPGDSTCYTSCLLRIRLLRGEKLQPWQVYKAVHSAIQRRGYDPEIPWKRRATRKPTDRDGEDEEAGTRHRMEEFIRKMEAMAPSKPEFQFPCYFEAWKMGLWDSSRPDVLKERINCRAETTRNEIVPRRLVEEEIRELVKNAAKHYPKLTGQEDYLLYGPARQPYASYYPELRRKYGLREGAATDWQGVVGQKIPRFDNRIIEKCVLIPRLNVCKIRTAESGEFHPQSLLAAEVSFLLKLKNMRIQRCGQPTGLTAAEIKAVFENSEFSDFTITATGWKKKVCVPLNAHPLPGHESVERPRTSGRSRFCRPALAILKRLILSGKAPNDFYQDELSRLNGNTDPMKGLVPEDLEFLLDMGATWEGIYVPNQKLEALERSSAEPQEAIRKLIGSQNDPIVRHRLALFADRLAELQERFGKPDHIVLEFVREDFMGRKAKLEYFRFQKERATERAQARKEAEAAGAAEGAAGLKMELLKAQDGICLYTGEPLVPTSLDQYCIDHIVPRAKDGPDAAINYVLTTRRANDDKGDRTPFEWLSAMNGWDAYVNRVRARIGTLRNKKAQLLISPNAEELVRKYTALAETAWISKLAQTLIALQFGWRGGLENGERKITIISGGLTGRVRRKYRLNSLLNPEAENEEEAEKKNRDDARHHALDAMVISFIPNWARDAKKTGFFRFPESVTRGFFQQEIQDIDVHNVCFEKPQFEETSYGQRVLGSEAFIVGREELCGLAVKIINNRRVLKPIQNIETHRIVETKIRNDVELFLRAQTELTLQEWDKWCENYRLTPKGPHVRKLFVTKTKPGATEEYKDISKDATGQFRRGAKHRGYFVYDRPDPTKKQPDRRQVEVRPVYVFESRKQIMHELSSEPGFAIIGYFESGCQVRTAKQWEFRGKVYPSGEYICTSIWTNRNAKLKHPQFGEIGPVGLRILLDAGLQRLLRV